MQILGSEKYMNESLGDMTNFFKVKTYKVLSVFEAGPCGPIMTMQ